jgi:hypothetical protein
MKSRGCALTLVSCKQMGSFEIEKLLKYPPRQQPADGRKYFPGLAVLEITKGSLPLFTPFVILFAYNESRHHESSDTAFAN